MQFRKKQTLLIMFFFFFICNGLSAQLSQKIDIQLEKATIKSFFTAIENQTDYTFMYNNLDLTTPVTITTRQTELSTVLDRVLSPLNIEYEVSGKRIILKKQPAKDLSENNKTTITGTVTDERGEPIIGANLVEKGTTNGVVTDYNGQFSIPVTKNAVLQISYIGYIAQELTLGSKTSVNIVLKEDLKQLEEVVVVGYGTQKRGLVTGSLSVTDGGEIAQSKTQNLSLALQGRLPGVVINNRSGEPGADNTSVNIRGRSTTGNNDPLILIDGIANRGGLDRINPNDIESVTVLKDASASIYGARSANGVILVTTKRGKIGKPSISYSYNVGLQSPTRLPEMADAATYASALNEIEFYEGRNPRYTDDEIQKFRDGSDPIHYPNTDWKSETLRKTALQQRHNISISGANDRVSYYVGGGYSDQDGIYKKSSTYYKQYDIRSNIDATITKNFKVSVDISGRIEDRHYSGESSNNIFWGLLRGLPTELARYPDGSPTYGMDIGNPVTMVTDETGYRDYKKYIFNSTVSAKIDLPWITEGLSVDGYIAFDKVGEEHKDWLTPAFYYTWDETTDIYEKHKYARREYASLSQEYLPTSSFTLNAKIMYKKTFASLHGVDAMVGFEQNEFKGHNFSGSRSNYLSTAIDQLFAGSSDKQYINNGGSAYDQARRSLFGRLAYDYAGKYMAQFNFRYDGSYIFASNKRWGFFPGISLGWRLSEEKFLKDNVSWLNSLKLRASYGQQGNDNVGAFQYLLKYAMGRNYVFGGADVEGIYQESLPNEAITWEVAKTYNLGLDGTLWDGKLGFEIDLFQTRRSNILTARNASIPQYTGLINLPNENIGEVKNQGIELQLSHYSKLGEVGLNLSGNFMFARNKVIDVDETPWGEGYEYMNAEGKPMGTELYYQAIGIFRDEEQLNSYPHLEGARPGDLIFKDVDGNGVIDGMDRVRANLMHFPEIVFGLNIGLDWKNFDFTMLLQGQARAQQAVYTRLDNTGNSFKSMTDDRWTINNIDGTMPRPGGSINNNYSSDFWLKDASFLRLKNIEVGYTLPQVWFNKIRVSNCRVYLSGYNLLTLDKIKVMDPESDNSGASYYPQMKIFNLGVSLTF